MTLIEKLNTLIIGLDEIVDALNEQQSEDYKQGYLEGLMKGRAEMRTLAAGVAERLYGHKEARQAIMNISFDKI